MALFILAIVFGVIALLALVVGVLLKKNPPEKTDRYGQGRGEFVDNAHWWATGPAIGIGLLAGLFLLLSCLTSIGTQDIGVKTAFGKTVGSGLKPGIHFKAPWEKVHKLDFKTQTATYASNGYSTDNADNQSGATGGCVNVRIARQATACVNITVRWQNNQDGVDYLFKNYKTDQNIRDNLLHRDLQTAVNVAFAGYDPLGIDSNGRSTQPTTTQLATVVENALANQDQIKGRLTIQNVYIPIFNFDKDTQARLNQLQLQVAQTRIAVQTEQTAAAQAAANRKLAASVSHDPNVLISKCLDIVKELNGNLPAGFSCFGSGTGISVAVPNRSTK